MKRAYSLRFSRSAKTYDRWAVPQRISAHKLVKMVSPRGRILDVGCGTGFVSRSLEGDVDIVGIDISPEMVREYVKEVPSGMVGDVEELPFKDRSFDWVLSNFTLHWTNVKKSLPEMVRVSRKGIGISLPVEGSLEGLGFPFPKVIDILRLLRGRRVMFYTENVEIPFKGMDLVYFFHYTGSSLNPKRRKTLTRKEIEDLVNSIDRAFFRMLFLYARV